MLPDIFSPKLYPADRRQSVKWFIRFFEKDYTAGRLVPKKYYGLLNVEKDITKRLELAGQYIDLIKKGHPLPNYAGKKKMPPPGFQSNFASVQTCLDQFLKYKAREVRKSTIIQYRANCNALIRWLYENELHQMSIGAIHKDHAREFLNHMQERHGVGNRTSNGYKVLFGSVWQEYVNDGKIKTNPWRQIKSLPKQTRHLKSFPPELRAYIRETLPTYDRQLWLFLQCIYYCAIRPHSELRLMKVKHLVAEGGLFYVPAELSKNKHARMINIYHDLLAQLVALGYPTFNPEFYLFTKLGTPGPVPASINYFKNQWRGYKKAFNIADEYKLYGSKHTGGKALSKRYNQYITQEHFGHSSQDATRHYINDLGAGELNFLQKDYPVF